MGLDVRGYTTYMGICLPTEMSPLITSLMLKRGPNDCRNSSTITASPKSSGGRVVSIGLGGGSSYMHKAIKCT